MSGGIAQNADPLGQDHAAELRPADSLVCLAVWMCYSARTTAGRIITLVPPIAAFVAAGFEHSIANVYFLTIALLIKGRAPETFWRAINQFPADFGSL